MLIQNLFFFNKGQQLIQEINVTEKSNEAKFCIKMFIKDNLFCIFDSVMRVMILNTDTMIDHKLSTFLHLKDIHIVGWRNFSK